MRLCDFGALRSRSAEEFSEPFPLCALPLYPCEAEATGLKLLDAWPGGGSLPPQKPADCLASAANSMAHMQWVTPPCSLAEQNCAGASTAGTSNIMTKVGIAMNDHDHQYDPKRLGAMSMARWAPLWSGHRRWDCMIMRELVCVQPTRCLPAATMIFLMMSAELYLGVTLMLMAYMIPWPWTFSKNEPTSDFVEAHQIPFVNLPQVEETHLTTVSLKVNGIFAAITKMEEPLPAVPIPTLQVSTMLIQRRRLCRPVPIPGDGNCLWYAAAQQLSLPWQQVKRQSLSLLRSSLQKAGSPWQTSMARSMEPDYVWADTYALQSIAQTFGVSIYLHCPDSIWRVTPSFEKRKPINLMYEQHHFQAAILMKDYLRTNGQVTQRPVHLRGGHSNAAQPDVYHPEDHVSHDLTSAWYEYPCLESLYAMVEHYDTAKNRVFEDSYGTTSRATTRTTSRATTTTVLHHHQRHEEYAASVPILETGARTYLSRLQFMKGGMQNTTPDEHDHDGILSQGYSEYSFDKALEDADLPIDRWVEIEHQMQDELEVEQATKPKRPRLVPHSDASPDIRSKTEQYPSSMHCLPSSLRLGPHQQGQASDSRTPSTTSQSLSIPSPAPPGPCSRQFGWVPTFDQQVTLCATTPVGSTTTWTNSSHIESQVMPSRPVPRSDAHTDAFLCLFGGAGRQGHDDQTDEDGAAGQSEYGTDPSVSTEPYHSPVQASAKAVSSCAKQNRSISSTQPFVAATTSRTTGARSRTPARWSRPLTAPPQPAWLISKNPYGLKYNTLVHSGSHTWTYLPLSQQFSLRKWNPTL